MPHVRLTRPILIGTHTHAAGETVDVPDGRAADLVRSGAGVLVPPPAVETRVAPAPAQAGRATAPRQQK